MFSEIRSYTATLSYYTAGSYDSNNNFVEGIKTDIEIVCSKKAGVSNKTLATDNRINNYTFSLATDVIDTLDLTKDYKVLFEGVNYEVVHISIRRFIGDMVIYVK